MVSGFCGFSPRQAAAAAAETLERAGCPDAGFDAAELVRAVTGRTPHFEGAPLSETESEKLLSLVTRRAEREPLQYLLGEWDFLDFTLKVGSGVLCPRADTEVVCEAAVACLAGRKSPKVLDLCAGSGCLGLGVARLCPGASVTCVEKSPEALRWLRLNTEHAEGVWAAEGDIFTFQNGLAPESLDLIVCNPPYLTAQEMRTLQPEVAKEPAMALDGGEDGGDFYRHIAKEYRAALRSGGWLVFEIGWQQQELLRRILAEAGWNNPAECRKDYGGNDRVILIQK